MDSVSESGNGVDGPARWSLRLFGGFELNTLPGGKPVDLPGKRERILLAYLALSPNCSQPRRKLVTLLWGDSAGEAAPDNLRTCLWRLRKSLGDSKHRAIVSDGDSITLDATAFDVDALRFDQLAAQNGRAELEATANLYTGELLDGLGIESEEFESWRREEAGRFKDQAINVLTRLMNRLAEGGAADEAIAAGQKALRVDPLHEPTVRCLMQLYARSGQRRSAVQLYRAVSDALRAELDVEPEDETRALFAEISRSGEARIPALAAPLSVKAEAKGPVGTVHAHRAQPNPPDPAQHLGAAISASQNVTPSRPRWTAWMFAGSLATMLAIFLLYHFAAPPGTTTARQAGDVDASAVSLSAANAISLAVLPFINLSGDPSQDFFSDGITEEITIALAKVPDLRVVARTSAYQFKGERRDVQSIGQQLHATHLIEGSVRRQGDRVRISAQLIQANNGAYLWTETHDRQLTDVFRAQEDIAKAIAHALHVPLGLQPGGALISNRTEDLNSYEQYLRARALYRAYSMQEAIRVLEPVVLSNPGFAPAWGLLVQVYALAGIRPADKILYYDKAEKAAREAIRLDPRNALAHAALADVDSLRGRWTAGEDGFRRALALDPGDPDIINRYSARLGVAGRIREALSLREKLTAIEPFVPRYNAGTARIMVSASQTRAAIAILERTVADVAPTIVNRNVALAHAYAMEGRYSEAADTLLMMLHQDVCCHRAVEDAARILRSAPQKTQSPQALPALEGLIGQLNFVYIYVGALDRVLDNPERTVVVEGTFAQQLDALWDPQTAPLRKTLRFKKFVRDAGLFDYWREQRWPDLCHPVGLDDFDCD
jgi:adenylate cyclase